jgi:beta-glucosidase-like glycosyl hydrolase
VQEICVKDYAQIALNPITIEINEAGHYRNITSVEEANEFLLHDWPQEKGLAQLAARRACLDALMGKVAAEEARAAFIEAAKESGIYIAEGLQWR